MTTTRNLKQWSQANTCDACKKLSPPIVTLATKGCTDSREVTPGVFEETPTRFGCQQHNVAPVVYYLDGAVKPLSEVLPCQ